MLTDNRDTTLAVSTVPQSFFNEEFGTVRAMSDEKGDPIFCLGDVCKILDLRVDAVVRRLKDDPTTNGGIPCNDMVLSKHPVLDALGRTQMVYFVNEDGFFDSFLDSRKPIARRFRKWVTSEVLPAIRKHGAYMTPETIKRTLSDPDFIIELAQRLKSEIAKNAELERQVEVMAPKSGYCDSILRCPDLVSTTAIAKDYGFSATAFNRILNQLGIQYRVGKLWVLYQRYASQGYTQSQTFYKDDHAYQHTCWTQRGRLFLYTELKKHGYLPVIEIKG